MASEVRTLAELWETDGGRMGRIEVTILKISPLKTIYSYPQGKSLAWRHALITDGTAALPLVVWEEDARDEALSLDRRVRLSGLYKNEEHDNLGIPKRMKSMDGDPHTYDYDTMIDIDDWLPDYVYGENEGSGRIKDIDQPTVYACCNGEKCYHKKLGIDGKCPTCKKKERHPGSWSYGTIYIETDKEVKTVKVFTNITNEIYKMLIGKDIPTPYTESALEKAHARMEKHLKVKALRVVYKLDGEEIVKSIVKM